MIVITTPTGRIGSQLLGHLLDGGEPVRVIARDPSRIASHVRRRIEVIEGASDDPGVVDQALDGADSLFWLVPPNFAVGNATEYYLDFSRPVCAAITRRKTARVVAATSLGRDYSRPAWLLSAAFAMDQLIESTGVHYRALQMPFFMENILGQARAITTQDVLPMSNTADRPLASVATRDVATVAAALLLDHSWTGQVGVPVVGPDDLTPRQMAEIVSAVAGRQISLQETPADTLKEAMVHHGASPGFADDMVAMVQAQNDGIYDAEQRTSSCTTTTFRQWCELVLKPALPT